MPEPAAIPEAIARAPDLIRKRDTPIDRHPQRDDILRFLAAYVLTPQADRISVADLLVELTAEFEGLVWDVKDPEAALERYIERHVAPAVCVTADFIRRGILTGRHNLNVVERKLALYEKLQARAEEALDALGAPQSDDPAVIAAASRDAAALAKAALAAAKEVEDSMARFGIYPSSKVAVEKTTTTHIVDWAALGAQRNQGKPGFGKEARVN